MLTMLFLRMVANVRLVSAEYRCSDYIRHGHSRLKTCVSYCFNVDFQEYNFHIISSDQVQLLEQFRHFRSDYFRAHFGLLLGKTRVCSHVGGGDGYRKRAPLRNLLISPRTRASVGIRYLDLGTMSFRDTGSKEANSGGVA